MKVEVEVVVHDIWSRFTPRLKPSRLHIVNEKIYSEQGGPTFQFQGECLDLKTEVPFLTLLLRNPAISQFQIITTVT